MEKENVPEGIEDDPEELREVPVEEIADSSVRLLENKFPTGGWYVVYDGEVIEQGSKVGGWNEAVGFAKGAAHALD